MRVHVAKIACGLRRARRDLKQPLESVSTTEAGSEFQSLKVLWVTKFDKLLVEALLVLYLNLWEDLIWRSANFPVNMTVHDIQYCLVYCCPVLINTTLVLVTISEFILQFIFIQKTAVLLHFASEKGIIQLTI